ncbi:MAG: hypothetical protein M3Y87_12095 [Myxococcota bacterium]|nr:hypothetical protein [Myxococcota bacterium]
MDTLAPGMAERIAARPAMSRGDWRGCIDALRGAPPTLDVLSDRASCAHHARDRAELERTCAALQRHHAGAPQAHACDGMLLTLR